MTRRLIRCWRCQSVETHNSFALHIEGHSVRITRRWCDDGAGQPWSIQIGRTHEFVRSAVKRVRLESSVSIAINRCSECKAPTRASIVYQPVSIALISFLLSCMFSISLSAPSVLFERQLLLGKRSQTRIFEI